MSGVSHEHDHNSTPFLQDLVAEKCAEYFERFRRRMFVTPKSYLSFINSYKIIYTEKITHVGTLAERVKTGEAKPVVHPFPGMHYRSLNCVCVHLFW